MFSDDFTSQTEVVMFDIVQMPYQYNAILGWATLNTFGAITHQNYLCMKIPAMEGKITVRGDQDGARQAELEIILLTHYVHAIEADANARADTPLAIWRDGLQRPNQRGSFEESL